MQRPGAIFGWLILLVGLGVGGGWYWWQQQQDRLPPGIAAGNGRLEAQEVDIATKFPGRITEVLVDEGDAVEAGQILARMDARSLRADLVVAEAEARHARRNLELARATHRQRESDLRFADQELARALFLFQKGHITKELLDQRQTEIDSASAALAAARAEVGGAEHRIEAALAQVERIKADLDETVLITPRGGRVLYRLAEPGEVLPAGGKVLTVIDLNDAYITLFLPALEAGKVPIGADARIVLDALPEQPIVAKVTFVAAKAQFTPKDVETASERQKLVFRVKAQVVDGAGRNLKPGMPGVAYIRYDERAAWPANLR